MKRILAILCVIACLCGLCVPAMAAGTITVHVKAPNEWTEVYLYVWESDAMADWPGTAMTKGADGWWTLEIPTGYTNVIANNGNEKPQTNDLKMDGNSDAWITVGEDTGDGKHFNATVAKDASGTPSTVPVPTFGSLGIVGDGVPGLQSWVVEDAAGDMSKVSENVYSCVLSFTAGASMKFKFAANHSWDKNFGGASADMSVAAGATIDMVSGGQDLTFTAAKDGNVKFTVTVTATGATLKVEETDEEAAIGGGNNGGSTDVPTGEMITVYAKFPADWKGACVWAWDDGKGNATNAGWPGDLYLVKGENGWWSVQVPNWVTGILINANGGGVQTPDIKGFEVGKDIWINAYTDPQNPVYSHEEITDIKPPAETEPVTAPTRETVPPTEPSGTQGENKDGKDLTVLLSIIGSVVIIAIAAVVVIIVKSKKKAA